jgi:hypothetical protein
VEIFGSNYLRKSKNNFEVPTNVASDISHKCSKYQFEIIYISATQIGKNVDLSFVNNAHLHISKI